MDAAEPAEKESRVGRTPPSDDRALLAECRVDTFTSGGKGGQHQNRTQSGVRLVHLPSGIAVSSRRHRSQRRNQQAALDELRRRLEAASRPPEPRVQTKVPKREKERRRTEKSRRSKTKERRRPPPVDD